LFLLIKKKCLTLWECTRYANESQRLKWIPLINSEKKVELKECLSQLKSVWQARNLGKYVDVTIRQKTILDGMPITPNETDFVNFLYIFNVNMLNAVSRSSQNKSEELFRIVDNIGHLPLPEEIRSLVWGAMAERLYPKKFRRELKDIATKLKSLSKKDAETWAVSLIETSKKVAFNCKDDLLQEEAERAEADLERVQYIVKWGESIQFQHERTQQTSPVTKDEIEITLKKNSNEKGIKNHAQKQLDMSTKLEIEKWVLQRRIPSLNAFIEDLVDQISISSEKIINLISKARSISGIQALSTSIESFRNRLKEKLYLLPDLSLLTKDLEESHRIFHKYHERLGDDIYKLMKKAITPKDLKEIGDLMEKRERIIKLPSWLWADIENIGSNVEHKNSFCVFLANPTARKRIISSLAILSNLDDSMMDFVNQISPPPEGEHIEAYFQKAVQKALQFGEKFSQMDKSYYQWIKNAMHDGMNEEIILECAIQLDDLKGRVIESAFLKIIEKISEALSNNERLTSLMLFDKAVVFIEGQFGSAVSVPYEMIENWINNNSEKILLEKTLTDPEIEVTLEHNWIDHPHRKLRLAYTKYPRNINGNYGFVTAPVTFYAKFRPDDLNLRLSFDISSSLTRGWPKEWESPRPNELRILSTQWHEHKSSYIFPFKVEIPIRPPKEPRTKINLQIKVIDSDTDKQIGAKNKISWEYIENKPDKIILEWPDGIQTDYVSKHPIGPQEHLAYIENRLKGGSSFAIVSPRRFGKTTLAMYLQENGWKWGFVVPPPILCTNMVESGLAVSYKKIWRNFSDNLTEMVGASLKRSDGVLPDIDAFDHVRKAAKKQGKKGILLIFDEAQLFFPKSGGPHLGNHLKDILETEWSRRDRENKVPVFVGLIGLPGILEKMGANLQGFLMPKDTRTIRETKLNALIFKFTKSTLHTTKRAREQLCQKSGNLFILKTLLTELVSYVNDDHRNWIHYDDVVEVFDDLIKDLKGSRKPAISSYLRDVLNESEDVNYWQPRPCYPTAVALAKVILESNYNFPNIVSKATNLLNKWCLNAGFDETKRLIFTRERMMEHIRKIEELGVFDRRVGFHSDILAAWLFGMSTHFPNDEKDREALFAGALERIRLPEGRELIKTGTQAEIFRFYEKQNVYTLRTVLLSSQEDRYRFHETVKILKILKQQSILREEGAEYIYNLRDIGVADHYPSDGSEGMLGTEIYKWIDGTSLEEKIGKLPSPFIANIGIKLAKALMLIHRHGIIHRDICPRNIILNNQANPILIDFGLARHNKQILKTIIESEYTAPEINGPNPNWTSASDIFSLGKTLLKLISISVTPDRKLIKLLEICCADIPSKRPDSEDIVQQFDKILPSLHIQERQDSAWIKIKEIAGNDLNKNWFSEVLEKIKPIYLAISIGIHDNAFDRVSEIAQLLDFTLENFPSEESLKLSYVYNRKSDTIGDILKGKKCVGFLKDLRIGRNHIDPKKSRSKIIKKFRNPEDAQMVEWAKEGAILISRSLDLKSLPKIVEKFLE